MPIKRSLKNLYINISNILNKPKNNLYFFYGHYAYLKDKTNEFEVLLEQLHSYVDFINFDDAIKLLNEGKVSNFDKPTICFSFDDGFKECYTHIYPVLKKYNVNACFFINPNFTIGSEKYIENFKKEKVHINKEPMTADMIFEMSNNGFLFGSHTLNHANLSGLDDATLYKELKESKEWLENFLGLPCDYFAWPYGGIQHINENALKISLQIYPYVFSAIRSRNYFFKENRNVINRDHFEGFWRASHIKYFISQVKTWNFDIR
ncbi:polysaccharide deacetylase family protein [bacterium]|nr:polysaccharide deacetylase family protein [bacterium]MBU1433411.1 polysaccharide deacetylase family protein [bacterium]